MDRLHVHLRENLRERDVVREPFFVFAERSNALERFVWSRGIPGSFALIDAARSNFASKCETDSPFAESGWC